MIWWCSRLHVKTPHSCDRFFILWVSFYFDQDSCFLSLKTQCKEEKKHFVGLRTETTEKPLFQPLCSHVLWGILLVSSQPQMHLKNLQRVYWTFLRIGDAGCVCHLPSTPAWNKNAESPNHYETLHRNTEKC